MNIQEWEWEFDQWEWEEWEYSLCSRTPQLHARAAATSNTRNDCDATHLLNVLQLRCRCITRNQINSLIVMYDNIVVRSYAATMCSNM